MSTQASPVGHVSIGLQPEDPRWKRLLFKTVLQPKVASVLVILAGWLIAGVAVSIFQATTQINDMTLVFVPKVVATVLALILFGSWMLQTFLNFTRQIFLSLPTVLS